MIAKLKRKVNKDNEYLSLVENILIHNEFCKTKEEIHHGTTRYNHSLRVSFYSYKISKALNFNYEIAARGGLLHDFFVEDHLNEEEVKKPMSKHPKVAAANAEKYFGVTPKEINLIETHMFPLTLQVPTSKEGWVVTLVDKGVATYEFTRKFANYVSAALLFILNIY